MNQWYNRLVLAFIGALLLMNPQVSFGQSISDCEGAITLCGDFYTETEASFNTGAVYEYTGICNQSLEQSSVWYTFTVQADGLLSFIIDPLNPMDDYDWGLFDITSGPLRRAWDFRSGAPVRPERIEAARSLIGWEHLEWDGPYLRLPMKGMELDLGGIVKEYAVDCAVKRLRDAGVLSGMVDLAGDIAVIGNQPDGSPWQISIRDPFDEGSVCAVNLTDAAIATSGSYERRIAYQGKDYGHLLDPETGWPAPGPASVTVIDAHCLTAGAVATTACLLTEEKAANWLGSARLPWLMVDQKTVISGPISSDSTATAQDSVRSL